jgi:hypothetical protein
MPIRTLTRSSARLGTRLLLILSAVAAALGLTIASGVHNIAHASGCGSYITTATNANTIANWTNLPTTDPNAIVFATGGWAGTYDNHAIGVWWTGANWAVFNQDVAAMPLGATFHILPTAAFSSPTEDVFIHTATTSNIVGDYTILNDPVANGNPNAIVQVTANYNPPGLGGAYNNHAIGVWYTGSRWAIFNQDLAAMPVGAHFNVFVNIGPASHPSSGAYTHTATNGNIGGNVTYLPTPTVSASTVLLATPNYNPGGVGGTLHTHNIGVWWSGAKWTVFNQDVAAMAAGHSFNIWWQTC